jgi:hypothetical protein
MSLEAENESNPLYPTREMSMDNKRLWAQKYGIITTEEGLLLPSKDTEMLDRKIVGSVAEAHERIEAACAENKYGIYLPGSYDLAHIGHFSFVHQAIDHSLREIRRTSPDVKREDMYVVSLIDSDALVRHTKLHKNVAYGGDETFFRPIENGYDEQGRHPRLDAAATLPVDCVGFLPAPTDEHRLLPPVYPLDPDAAVDAIRKLNINEKANDAIMQALAQYDLLKKSVESNDPDFNNWWSIELWQLYLTLALGKGQISPADELPHPYAAGTLTRIISADDFKYFDEVQAISAIAGISVKKFDDVHAQSTTRLVHEYDPRQLLMSKKNALRQP